MTAGLQSVDPQEAASGSAQLDRLDLSTLASGAARLRPERIALSAGGAPHSKSITFAEFDLRANAAAQLWRRYGLQEGERVLFAGMPSSRSLIAMLGALRAGLDAALAGPHLARNELIAFTAATGASAIAVSAHPSLENFAEDVLHCAAANERVRLLANIGLDSEIDGAVIFDPFNAEGEDYPAPLPATQCAHARIITRDITGRLCIHRQRTLVAAALDFVSRAQIGTRLPLISTIYPASFAGLVAGPVAALAAGAPLALHAPFDAQTLISQIDNLRPVHLVAPAMIGDELAEAGLLNRESLASLVLLTRFKRLPADLAEEPARHIASGELPVFDLYALGECAALAEARSADGMRTPPLAQAHLLNFDGRELVAARRKLHYLARNGKLDTALSIEGLAVSPGAGDMDDGSE